MNRVDLARRRLNAARATAKKKYRVFIAAKKEYHAARRLYEKADMQNVLADAAIADAEADLILAQRSSLSPLLKERD